jgi:hypothetical protein
VYFLKQNPAGMPRAQQLPTEVVDVKGWGKDRFVHGKKEKKLLFCPKDSPYAFLIPQHRYLLKFSVERHPLEFWSEVIASIVGRLIGFNVVPVFVGHDSENNKFGALIEWFLDYPADTLGDGFFEGIHDFKRRVPDYNAERGEQHNIQDIIEIFTDLEEFYGVTVELQWMKDWADLLLFDALIGNSDRHQENWGKVLSFAEPPIHFYYSLSPFYDNGSSFAHERLEEKLPSSPEALEKYWDNSMSHINITRTDGILKQNGRLKLTTHHKKVLEFFIGKFPQYKDHLLCRLNFAIEPIRQELTILQKFDVTPRLSKKRADFIVDFLTHRQVKLQELIASL